MKFVLYAPEFICELGHRPNQEDAAYPLPAAATEACRLFVLCDGMGGCEQGEVASATVSSALGGHIAAAHEPHEVFADSDFEQALAAAYSALDGAASADEQPMGTTLAMLCFHRGGCMAAHIGDTRIYHLRPETGEILYRSRDHSLVNQLYETGEISYDEMRRSRKKNILLRAMQPGAARRTVADIVHITDIRPGDYFLMLTDGMLERMDGNELLELVEDDSTTDGQKRERLLQLTADNQDNHTAWLIHVKDVEHEAGDDTLPDDEAEARAASRALNDVSPDVEVMLAD